MEDEKKVVTITQTGTRISPYKKKQSSKLEYMTSMKDFGVRYKRIEVNGFICDNEFLTYHIPRFLIDNDFPDYQVVYEPSMKFRKFNQSINCDIHDDYVPTDTQCEVINQILTDNLHHRWFVNCPQGFGKTFISIYLISQMRINTLIMCYSTSILAQWREKIYEYTDFPMEKVLTLDSGKLISNIISGDFPIKDYNIFIATPTIITGYAKKHGHDEISKLFNKLGIGLKIYDEAHRNLANMIKIDALSSVLNTIYLSGDFAQASKYKTQYFYNMFEGVRKVRPNSEKMIDMRYTIAVVVEYNSHPTPMESLSVIKKRGLSIWDFMEYQIAKGTIIRVIDWIMDNITKLREKDRRILILTSMIYHCDILYNHIKSRYDNYIVGKIHGDNDPDDNENSKDNAQIIVATYSSFSTGMDTQNIKYVISTSASNRVEDSQASGRARPLASGEDCMFWMLVDIGFERLLEKEAQRIEYLREVKVKDVIKLTYEDSI